MLKIPKLSYIPQRFQLLQDECNFLSLPHLKKSKFIFIYLWKGRVGEFFFLKQVPPLIIIKKLFRRLVIGDCFVAEMFKMRSDGFYGLRLLPSSFMQSVVGRDENKMNRKFIFQWTCWTFNWIENWSDAWYRNPNLDIHVELMRKFEFNFYNWLSKTFPFEFHFSTHNISLIEKTLNWMKEHDRKNISQRFFSSISKEAKWQNLLK